MASYSNGRTGGTVIKKKVDDKVINDVISGKYGNGAERKEALENAGYNYNDVQSGVNNRFNGNSAGNTSKPSTTPTYNKPAYGGGSSSSKGGSSGGRYDDKGRQTHNADGSVYYDENGFDANGWSKPDANGTQFNKYGVSNWAHDQNYYYVDDAQVSNYAPWGRDPWGHPYDKDGYLMGTAHNKGKFNGQGYNPNGVWNDAEYQASLRPGNNYNVGWVHSGHPTANKEQFDRESAGFNAAVDNGFKPLPGDDWEQFLNGGGYTTDHSKFPGGMGGGSLSGSSTVDRLGGLNYISNNYQDLLKKALGFDFEDYLEGEKYGDLKDRYTEQGQLAMQDVLGQMAARTGGLASSYANTVGNQQFNDYMGQLNDVARKDYEFERGKLMDNANAAMKEDQWEFEKALKMRDQIREQQELELKQQQAAEKAKRAQAQGTEGVREYNDPVADTEDDYTHINADTGDMWGRFNEITKGYPSASPAAQGTGYPKHVSLPDLNMHFLSREDAMDKIMAMNISDGNKAWLIERVKKAYGA